MKCPVCKKDVVPGSAEYPFCSERCRTIDLGNWGSEKYVISTPLPPGAPEPDESDEDESE